MYVDDQTPSFFQSAFLVLTFLLLVATLPVLGFYYSLWGFVPPPSEALAAPGSAAALLIAYLAVGTFALTTMILMLVETGRLNNSSTEQVSSKRGWPLLLLIVGFVGLVTRDLAIWILLYADVLDSGFQLPASPSYLLQALVLLAAVTVLIRHFRR